MSADLAALEARLGHVFADRAVVEEALTHPSLTGRRASYDRLEFLGDRVLGLVVADHLHQRFPAAPAGELATRYNRLVREGTLAEMARALGLDAYLRLDRATREAGVAQKDAVLADAMEALLAAVYRDAGLAKARDVVLALIEPLVDRPAAADKDAKSTLQEWAAARGLGVPDYRLADRAGPDHAPVFTVTVALGADEASGEGPSKRVAETRAAAALLARVKP